MSPIDRPLFLVGTGRCGSTVLHEMLAHHEHLSYLTHSLDCFPRRPRLNARLMGLREHAAWRRLLTWRIEPSEAWHFWDALVPGFSEPCRDLVASDAGPRARRRVGSTLPLTLRRPQDRLLVKFTGWPRLGWILACFPDARVVHVVRDARAVTNSLMNVDWWHGWSGPDCWSFGPLEPLEDELWRETGRDFAALGCLQWNRLVRAWHHATSQLPPERRAQLLEIRYDDLCADRDATLRRVLDFAGMEWTPRFAAQAGRYALDSRDDKWRRDLSEGSQSAMHRVLNTVRWTEIYSPADEPDAASLRSVRPSSSS